MTELLENPRTIPGFDLDEWESRLDEGGGGFGNGNFNGDDDGDHWRGDDNDGDNDGDISPEVAMGLFGGAFVGLLGSIVMSGEYDHIAMNQYIAKHHITTEAGKNYAWENAPNKNVELATFCGPILLLGAVGAAIVYQIKKRRNG